MFTRFAIPSPDNSPPDGFRPDDFAGCPPAFEAHQRGSWTDVGGDEPPVDLTGTADGWA
jgi:hypothetical protein